MSGMFYFKVHPVHWEYESDATTIYRALELADGSYLVTFKDNTNRTIEMIFTCDEIKDSLTQGYYIITDENGE